MLTIEINQKITITKIIVNITKLNLTVNTIVSEVIQVQKDNELRQILSQKETMIT